MLRRVCALADSVLHVPWFQFTSGEEPAGDVSDSLGAALFFRMVLCARVMAAAVAVSVGMTAPFLFGPEPSASSARGGGETKVEEMQLRK